MDIALRPVLLTVAWGLMSCSILLYAIFQGYFIPGYGYTPYTDLTGLYVAYFLILLTAVSSGMLLAEPGRALASFLGSLLIVVVVEYIVLMLPSLLGIVGIAQLGQLGILSLPDLAIGLVFYSIFPIVLMLSLFGAVAGSLLGERFLD